jgi:RNA-directed DNA polymerase
MPRNRKSDWTMDDVASVENLFYAAAKARRGKSRIPEVEDWWLRRESEISALREELLSGVYRPGPCRTFEIFEPKRRMIVAAPFRDRVAHHALCNLLAPALQRRFISRSYSCQVGKGTTAARECCRKLTNRFAYVLKCDVRKFYANIDHAVLLEKLAPHTRCSRVQALIGTILSTHRTGPEEPPRFIAGDDLMDGMRPRGLPIGNLTSQLWGNFYLDEMDHVLTEQEAHGDYLRYTDDFLLFGDDKERLWALKETVIRELSRVRLALAEPKSRLLAVREGVPFCGFRFLPGLRPRILGATKRRFERRRHAMWKAETPWREIGVSVFSWYQFSREGNSEGLRRAYVRWPFDPRLRRRHRRTTRVLRGGSWNNNNPRNLLSSYRNNNHPGNRNDNNGFRVVLSSSVPKAGACAR